MEVWNVIEGHGIPRKNDDGKEKQWNVIEGHGISRKNDVRKKKHIV